MTLSEYVKLKQQIELIAEKSYQYNNVLENFKEMFKKDINSPRKFELINSVADLFNILELRDVLSEDDLSSFKEIAVKLPNSNALLKQIIDYEARHVLLGSISAEYNGKDSKNFISNSYSPEQLGSNKIIAINEKIINEIGIFWKDLARNLGFRECELDDIDQTTRSLTEKAKIVLDNYYKKVDSQKWFFLLCKALDKSRRKDLSKSIQNIMI